MSQQKRYQLPKHDNGCPPLFLAPMEGVGSRAFRMALTTIGGFDEACTEFLRVPSNAHVQSLAKKYFADDTAPIPQAAQVMGSDPYLMAAMAKELEGRGAPRIDLNCGCPSGRVTGRGAGSTLLKTPDFLHEVALALVEAVDVPVSIKMRAGFDDDSLLKENLLAAESSGAVFITLHPRTKVEGYSMPSHWDRLAYAKEVLSVPLIGSGDVVDIDSCVKMIEETRVDGVMIGRAAVTNPWIFHEIKAHFDVAHRLLNWHETEEYLHKFLSSLPVDTKERSRINQTKQLLRFMFGRTDNLKVTAPTILTSCPNTAEELLARAIPFLKNALEENFR